MKYIVLETLDGLKLPILFPDILTHSIVAGAMQLAVDTLDKAKDLRAQQCVGLLERGSAQPVSAGFVSIGTDVSVDGESESLGGVKHNPADAGRIMFGDTVGFSPDSFVEMLMLRFRE